MYYFLKRQHSKWYFVHKKFGRKKKKLLLILEKKKKFIIFFRPNFSAPNRRLTLIKRVPKLRFELVSLLFLACFSIEKSIISVLEDVSPTKNLIILLLPIVIWISPSDRTFLPRILSRQSNGTISITKLTFQIARYLRRNFP